MGMKNIFLVGVSLCVGLLSVRCQHADSSGAAVSSARPSANRASTTGEVDFFSLSCRSSQARRWYFVTYPAFGGNGIFTSYESVSGSRKPTRIATMKYPTKTEDTMSILESDDKNGSHEFLLHLRQSGEIDWEKNSTYKGALGDTAFSDCSFSSFNYECKQRGKASIFLDTTSEKGRVAVGLGSTKDPLREATLNNFVPMRCPGCFRFEYSINKINYQLSTTPQSSLDVSILTATQEDGKTMKCNRLSL
jgi:hypothetical protein